MKIKSMALAATLALGVAAGAGTRAEDGPSREDLARQIVDRWSAHVDQTYPINAASWAVEMAPAFAEASIEELRAAASAERFTDMNTLLLGAQPGGGTQALGDAARDLVFVPVEPCRLFDTRLTAGPIPANGTRNFDVSVAGTYTAQGGTASDCGLSAGGSFAAAVINLTVVGPNAPGYITAYPFNAAQPLASSLNYDTGDIVGNEVVVKLDLGPASSELTVYSFAQTHLVGDIVGYFAAPMATPVQCVDTTAVQVIQQNAGANFYSPSCPAGYNITGGGCTSNSYATRLVSFRTEAVTNNHFCSYYNEALTTEVTAYARCCRVPGR